MASMMRNPLQFRRLNHRYLKLHRIKNKLSPIYENFPFLRNRKTIRYIRSSKVFFIMRGLPGSGKSTVVRAIKSRFKEAVICSADNFFVEEDGSYAYDFEKLPEAHEECANLAQRAANLGVLHVVIDNTNILRWEIGKYLALAREFGYAVLVVEPKTPWKLEPMELAARNTHEVTVAVVEQKLKKFKAVLPIYWGWFLNETATSELLTLGQTYFDLCMRTVPEFATYMNELGVAKGLTLPLSFKDFYRGPRGRLLHCTSFFSGRKNYRSPGTDEYADRPEVQCSMGRAFSLKLAGIMISPRTVGIRVILNKLQLPLWGQEDVWSPQPPPEPKNKDAAPSTDGTEVLAQDTPKVQKQKKNRKRCGDASTDLKRDENVTDGGGGVCLTDAFDSSSSDVNLDIQVQMAPDQSDAEIAPDQNGIKIARDQSGLKMPHYPLAINIALEQNGIEVEPDQSGTNMALAAESVKLASEISDAVARDDRTEDNLEMMLDVSDISPCFSCLESNSSSITGREDHSDISADKLFQMPPTCQEDFSDVSDKFCQIPSLSVENENNPVDKFCQMPSTRLEDFSDASADKFCQMSQMNEEKNQSNSPVDKFFQVQTDSTSLQDHHELIPNESCDFNLGEFLPQDTESADTHKLSAPNISRHERTSTFLKNSTEKIDVPDLSASDVCPERPPNNDSTPVEGNSNEVPRIQLKQGSRTHMTLGCAEGYSAVQTGFDQMELLLCEDNEAVVGEPVVMDDVEITYYGEGRCTVYFDWPIYKSALFTGNY